MDWERHKATWPHAAHSRFILSKPHRWHVQEAGDGPLILLIHGAGGGTQSWRHLFPLLTPDHQVVMMDLPGQGFTRSGAQQRLGLAPMAQDLRALCDDQGWVPQVIMGHSAGAAIALEMARYMTPAPAVIGLNAALGKFPGLAGVLFPAIAKALAMTPMVARMFTVSTANPNAVRRLINGTGSALSEAELAGYRALIGDPTHVNGALGMMAQWDLGPLLDALPSHPSRTFLITGDKDTTVPPSVSVEAATRMPDAAHLSLPGLGHLAHEEDAETVFSTLQPFLAEKLSA
ncbi:MAG: alpha/beta fold hydrolase BchO [Pseudomonadota bacterium]